MTLEARHISYAYTPGSDVIRHATVSLDEGRITFLLGANGSGKTTLLECLAGLRMPHAGAVLLDEQDLRRLSPRLRARRIGLVPQMHEPTFSYTVADVVLMGRAPHMGLFARPSAEDWRAVDVALEAVGLSGLRDRPYDRTSGGERQLALVARGLAQGAAYLLMDEPAAHLDPHHQAGVFDAISCLAADGFSVTIASHQPNNALLYGDRAVFLIGGSSDLQGAPSEAISEETLRAAYGMDFEIVRGTERGEPSTPRAVLPLSRHPRRAELTPASDR